MRRRCDIESAQSLAASAGSRRQNDRRTRPVVAFLPRWVGYAWAFPRVDHFSFGIATTQDAFDHKSLDALLWDFMASYYEGAQVGNSRPKMRLWKREAMPINNLRYDNLRKTA